MAQKGRREMGAGSVATRTAEGETRDCARGEPEASGPLSLPRITVASIDHKILFCRETILDP